MTPKDTVVDDKDQPEGDNPDDLDEVSDPDALVDGSEAAEEDQDKDEDDEPTQAKKKSDHDEDDDEPDPDDVEEDLDTILKDRIASGDDEDEDEDEDEVPKRTTEKVVEPGTKVPPRQPDEFVCDSCFLVKPNSQLADAKNNLCQDCV